MNLLEAWKDSLEILRPKNFKLFLLVTLNSIVQTYKTLITRLGLFIGLFFAALFVFSFVVPRTYAYAVVVFAFAVLFVLLLLFATILAARPSTLKKNISYFLSYKKHFLYFVVCLALFGVAVSALGFLLFKLGLFPSFHLIFKLDQPLWWAWILFFVDTKPSFVNCFMALWRTIKMFIYNAPFWLFGYFLPLWVVQSIFWPIYAYLPASVMPGTLIAGGLALVIPICYVTNFYVKKIHDQFNLYYGKKS